MYPTLAAEMARRGLNRRKLAQKIGIPESTLNYKLSAKGSLKLKDMKKIKEAIGVEMPLEILFEETQNKTA